MLPTLLIICSIIIFLFIVQVKPRQKISQVAKSGNGNLLILAFSRARKGVYRKILAVYSTAANTGLFHPSFFVLLFLTRMPLTFSWPIPYGADRLYMAPPLSLFQPQRPLELAIGTLNPRCVQGFGLVQAIWLVERGGFDVILLIKTKLHS